MIYKKIDCESISLKNNELKNINIILNTTNPAHDITIELRIGKKKEINIHSLLNKIFQENIFDESEKKQDIEMSKILKKFYKQYNNEKYINQIKINKPFTFPLKFNDLNFEFFKSPIEICLIIEQNIIN